MNIQPDRQGNLQALERAVAAVSGYNESHSSGAQIGGMLAGIFAGLFGDREAPVVEAPRKNDVDVAESIFNRFQPQMNRIGLQLEFNRERTDVMALSFDWPEHAAHNSGVRGIPLESQRIEISVADSDRLLSFFKSLTQAEVKNPLAQSALEKVSAEIDRFIVRTYIFEELGRGEGDAEQLYEVAGNISSELQRLGQKQAASILTSHLQHIWQGDLREQILAERGHILPSNQFAPHNWHIDSTPENYRTRWDGALDCLAQVAENPRAARIFDEAYGYLTESLRVAVEYFGALERNAEANINMVRLVPEYRTILSDMSERLSTIQR